MLYDGRWKYIGTKNHKYLFENIYNHKVISMGQRSYDNIMNGTDTISHYISRNLPVQLNPIVDNHIRSQNSYRKYYHATKKLSK